MEALKKMFVNMCLGFSQFHQTLSKMERSYSAVFELFHYCRVILKTKVTWILKKWFLIIDNFVAKAPEKSP